MEDMLHSGVDSNSLHNYRMTRKDWSYEARDVNEALQVIIE